MDRYEKRRQRLKDLIKDKCGGRISVCARLIDRNQSYVGRLLYPEGKKGKRNISDGIIVLIEDAFDLPSGWLDGVEMDPDIQAIAKLWTTLSPYKRMIIKNVIKTIAESDDPFYSVTESPAGSSSALVRPDSDCDPICVPPVSTPDDARAPLAAAAAEDRRHSERRETPLRRNTNCGTSTH